MVHRIGLRFYWRWVYEALEVRQVAARKSQGRSGNLLARRSGFGAKIRTTRKGYQS